MHPCGHLMRPWWQVGYGYAPIPHMLLVLVVLTSSTFKHLPFSRSRRGRHWTLANFSQSSESVMARCCKMLSLHSLFFLWVIALQRTQCAAAWNRPDDAIEKRQALGPSPLVDFQVYEPVLTPSGTTDQYGCIYTQLLMDHVFAYSYGMPFVGADNSCDGRIESMKADMVTRKLYTPTLRLQSRYHEPYGSF